MQLWAVVREGTMGRTTHTQHSRRPPGQPVVDFISCSPAGGTPTPTSCLPACGYGVPDRLSRRCLPPPLSRPTWCPWGRTSGSTWSWRGTLLSASTTCTAARRPRRWAAATPGCASVCRVGWVQLEGRLASGGQLPSTAGRQGGCSASQPPAPSRSCMHGCAALAAQLPKPHSHGAG